MVIESQNSPKRTSSALKSQRAAASLTTIVFGLLVIAVLYSGYKIIPFFYSYLEIENQMQAAARLASTESDADIRKKIAYHIKKLEIPVNLDKLKISRSSDAITISLSYDEIFYISLWGKDYDIHTFHFDAMVTELL